VRLKVIFLSPGFVTTKSTYKIRVGVSIEYFLRFVEVILHIKETIAGILLGRKLMNGRITKC